MAHTRNRCQNELYFRQKQNYFLSCFNSLHVHKRISIPKVTFYFSKMKSQNIQITAKDFTHDWVYLHNLPPEFFGCHFHVLNDNLQSLVVITAKEIMFRMESWGHRVKSSLACDAFHLAQKFSVGNSTDSPVKWKGFFPIQAKNLNFMSRLAIINLVDQKHTW